MALTRSFLYFAERVGFEPTVLLMGRHVSSVVLSTAQPPLHLFTHNVTRLFISLLTVPCGDYSFPGPLSHLSIYRLLILVCLGYSSIITLRFQKIFIITIFLVVL